MQSGLPGGFDHPEGLAELSCNKITLAGISAPFRMKILGKPDSYSLTVGSQCEFIHSLICSFVQLTSVECLLSAGTVLSSGNETELQRPRLWLLRDVIIQDGLTQPYQHPSAVALGP